MNRKNPSGVDVWNHFIRSKYSQHPIQDNQCPEKDWPLLPIPSPISKTSIYKSHTPSFIHLNKSYRKLCSSCRHPNQTTGHQEETHRPSHKLRCLHSYLTIQLLDTGIRKSNNCIHRSIIFSLCCHPVATDVYIHNMVFVRRKRCRKKRSKTVRDNLRQRYKQENGMVTWAKAVIAFTCFQWTY